MLGRGLHRGWKMLFRALCLKCVTQRVTVRDDSVVPTQGVETPFRGRRLTRDCCLTYGETPQDSGEVGCCHRASGYGLTGISIALTPGELAGFWAVTVRANWRVIFRFEDQDVLDVDYLDYH